MAVDSLAAGNIEARQFDLLGRATRIQEPDGNLRELGYDGESNVVRAKDRRYDVEFRYTGMNRLLSRTQAGTTVRFVYDTEENLTAIHNEAGAVYLAKRASQDPPANCTRSWLSAPGAALAATSACWPAPV